ncbi:hypothetical protein [Niallia circulans]
MLFNKTKLKENLQNLSIELVGDALTVAIALILGYYVKTTFFM